MIHTQHFAATAAKSRNEQKNGSRTNHLLMCGLRALKCVFVLICSNCSFVTVVPSLFLPFLTVLKKSSQIEKCARQ